MQNFIEGFVRYPHTLPCPQVDTDLVPRERRYISDITDVRNMRMFQQEFQATRNRISFIFTEEEAREFREWYTTDIIHGGAWFYADWPTLHKDKKIAHRFVGQPKYEWLLGANPGVMGRQIGRGGQLMQSRCIKLPPLWNFMSRVRSVRRAIRTRVRYIPIALRTRSPLKIVLEECRLRKAKMT